MKSASLLVSEVCRAWRANDANWRVLDAGTVIPDPMIVVGGTQAKCGRVLLGNPLELGGSGGNVDDERAQKFAAGAPKGVVLPMGGANPV